MTTQSEVRQSFWDYHPQFASERMPRKRQNDYRCDIRVAFVDYVETLRREGEISQGLADRITL